MANNAVYLTTQGKEKLEQELDHLRTVRRKEVALRLHEALEDGELIENAEYEAAKNEQAFIEGRILELEHKLATAKIIEPSNAKDVVSIGNTVVIRKERHRTNETFTIVGAAEADPKEGLISNESPLGKALLGHKVGDHVEVKAPAGVVGYKIVKIK